MAGNINRLTADPVKKRISEIADAKPAGFSVSKDELDTLNWPLLSLASQSACELYTIENAQ